MSTKPGAEKSVEVVSFGCRLNLVESEAMRRAALAQGQNDLVIVNTCAVTAEATRQARQAIRRIRRERPSARIAVTGCAAQIDPDRFARMPEVSFVLGNAGKTAASSWEQGPRPRVELGDIMSPANAGSPLSEGIEEHTRAFLAIQNGCDHRCTFCIIPYGRGPSRSVPGAEVLRAIEHFVAKGFREVVLTGVDLTSYGSDLEGQPKLGRLVKTILQNAPDLARLRLSSIDCIEADPDLVDAFANEARLMPYLHLSLQAGDDLTLKRMKRRHTRDEAQRFCTQLRGLRPNIVFGADLIAGFPGETEVMFQNTLALVTDYGLTHLHVFPFSPRPGTPAARMPPVAPAEVKERAGRLRERGRQALESHLNSQIGKTLRVLTERGGIGRAEDFTPVRLGPVPPGRMVDVSITHANGEELCGVVNANGP